MQRARGNPSRLAAAAAIAAATLLPTAACCLSACLQDLAKTNRVFVAPTDPTAALPYVQLGDL